MRKHLLRFICTLVVICQCEGVLRADDWVWVRGVDQENRIPLLAKELTLYPAPEPKPALKYRFIPDEFEQREGNAAIYYLRAMGFLEQNVLRDQLSRVWQAARQEAEQQGIDAYDLPPRSWLETPPDELPLGEVWKYLELTSFQPRDLKIARYLNGFELDRNVKNVESPTMTLLPEVQTMRELARNQSLRCRVAIAEGRADDAFEILGQQFAMASHLCEEPFLVSNLVGAAVAVIAWTDSLYLCQLPNAPNMYWAYAALPNPLIDLKKSMAYERQLLLLEIKDLSSVDETPRSEGYWSDFVDRVLPKYAAILQEFNINNENATPIDRFAFVSAIAAAYPGAKRYLLNELGMDKQLVEDYPIAQVVFLAQKRFYERARDDHFKWFFVLQSTRRPLDAQDLMGSRLQEQADQIGWSGYPATQLLPTVQAVTDVVKRGQLMVAISQTVEAIRMYAAENRGGLPSDLKLLSYPVPNDPFTGQPLEYKLDGDAALLTASAKNVAYKLTLRIAK